VKGRPRIGADTGFSLMGAGLRRAEAGRRGQATQSDNHSSEKPGRNGLPAGPRPLSCWKGAPPASIDGTGAGPVGRGYRESLDRGGKRGSSPPAPRRREQRGRARGSAGNSGLPLSLEAVAFMEATPRLPFLQPGPDHHLSMDLQAPGSAKTSPTGSEQQRPAPRVIVYTGGGCAASYGSRWQE